MNDSVSDSILSITSREPEIRERKQAGTGFVIFCDNEAAYIVTCSHVVRDVGGQGSVCVADKPATVVASRPTDDVDLAVLRVEGLQYRPCLPLKPLRSKLSQNLPIQIWGFSEIERSAPFLLRPLQGTLGQETQFSAYSDRRIAAWDLKIERANYLKQKGTLQGGYSGSPVIDADGSVLAVVTIQMDNSGEVGIALSIEALRAVWENMPDALVAQFTPVAEKPLTTRQGLTSLSKELNFSDILTELKQKFKGAPENITDPLWMGWFQDMFELQHNALERISYEIGKLLNAHRTTVYFLTEGDRSTKSKNERELWSIVAQGDSSLEIRVPFGEGVAGKAVETKKTISVPFDAYEAAEDAREIIAQDQRTGYRTYTLLTFPLLNEQSVPIAVFQFLNKMRPVSDLPNTISTEDCIDEVSIDKQGFSLTDQTKFERYIPEIRLILDLYQNYYQQFKKLQSIVNFSSATLSLNQERQNLEDILKLVIDEACKITNADRGTFWLLDRKGTTLRAKIRAEGDDWKEIKIRVGEGFAGEVAKSKQTLNIPFDLYSHPDSDKSRETDAKTGYRTCSLLCMPVFSRNSGELIGVTQLLNKRHNQSRQEPYHNTDSSRQEVPVYFKASFTLEDDERLRKFNEQVAIAIENARQPLITEQYDNLFQLLHATEQLAGGFLNAHSARIYLVDQDAKEIWSIVAEHEKEEPFEISIPIGFEECGQVAQSRNAAILGYQNVVPEMFSPSRKGRNSRYLVHNKLIVPIEQRSKRANHLLAVVEFMNKLRPEYASSKVLQAKMIAGEGFTSEDEDEFNHEHAISVAQLIEAFLEVYRPVKQYRDGEKLRHAKESVIRGGLEQALLPEQVMTAAKELVSAHRSTLWIVDPKDRDALYADITHTNGNVRRITATIGEGYVGEAAQQALDLIQHRRSNNEEDTGTDESSYDFLNIGFDLYEDEFKSRKAKQTDHTTNYRTCSLLCMPILSPEGELLGMIQLVNKLRRGYEHLARDEYVDKTPPPDCFMASFSSTDEQLMRDFNAAVGYVLQLIGVRDEVLDGDKIEDFERKLRRVQERG
ncbi:GAF domain-containing protein [Leptolyngbya cf. ectocarpi LEGE 11479]|uniref:GAF domain-containing protein n=1 Tax=Leptolyngbya cf. ectocarpi LEGE 11479 TaxID=1828722 RepID=A0A928ZRA0_LEPEC|nr:GAF domain-containing protein [Leptolyngbya ectocarpi]MBE9066313.1 GAF domain-containing protein [Leptolyngbya cf. ectocarpi LEGE 11479]